MPIRVQNDLPVKEILEKENIFVMDENRAVHQDIRPIQILILNLMPTKVVTENQLLRKLSNTPLSRTAVAGSESGILIGISFSSFLTMGRFFVRQTP